MEEQDTLRNLVRGEVQRVLTELDLVSKKDIQVLSDKIDALAQKLEKS
jgi:polyhydroxyalkanoate synthesis regulator phasin